MTYRLLKNSAELDHLRQSLTAKDGARPCRVLVCMTGCRALGAVELAGAFRDKLKVRGLEHKIEVADSGCHGQCSRAPLILIEPHNILYGRVKPADVDEIIEKTLLKGERIGRLCAEDGFYAGQMRELLRYCGRLDPRRIEDAIRCDGYRAAAKVLTGMSPDEVIAEVTEAGLRGRGGAGFPTGLKWEFCSKAPGTEKYLICNADEGDPGAFMDRALLEGTPHQVIEGMLIAAYAIGAGAGSMYVRAEYPIAVEHAGIAIGQARQLGLLGKNILGSGFDFDIQLRMGAGAFICGEETALIASLSGKRGMPEPRPPFPATSGYRGKPTNINNVETFANVPLIIEKGKQWYGSIGTEGGRGTKIFALAGKVNETGLVEVPLGATLRHIIFDVGGGIPHGRRFKAAQMGGPSGGCVPAEYLDLPIDYESVRKIGAIMGSGGLIVMDDKTCMVDVARFFLEFTQKESCGKCAPCRIGTRHMADILVRICEGTGVAGDIDALESIANTVKTGSLCGLGQTAPNPVITTIKYFWDEYEAHIRDKRCPAGVCKALISYSVIAGNCTACGKCKKVCPVDAIRGERKVMHEIDDLKCIRCGQCLDVCPFDAVLVE